MFSVLAPFWEPWRTLGPPFGIKNVSIGPLGHPLPAPVGPKTPPGTPKTSFFDNFGGVGEHFPPFLEAIRLHFAPCVYAFMPLCLHAFMPLALTFLPPRGSAAVLHTCIYIYIYQKDGGDPERFNGNSLAAMDGTGPMGNAIVLLLFPRRAGPPSPSRI